MLETALLTLGRPELRIRTVERSDDGIFFTASGSIGEGEPATFGLEGRRFQVAGSLERYDGGLRVGVAMVNGRDRFPIDVSLPRARLELVPVRLGSEAALVGFTSPRVDAIDTVSPSGAVVTGHPLPGGDVIVPTPPGSVVFVRGGGDLLMAQMIIGGIPDGMRPAPADAARETATTFARSLLDADIETAEALLWVDTPSAEPLSIQAAALQREGWRVAGVRTSSPVAISVMLRTGVSRARLDVEIGLGDDGPRIVTYGFRRVG